MFPDVVRRIDYETCVKCRRLFTRGDALLQIWVVAGVGPHPQTGRLTPWLMDDPLFGHGVCDNRPLVVGQVDVPRNRLVPMPSAELRARTPDYQCRRCQQKLKRGDCILTVVRVEGIVVDPSTKFPGVQCSTEWESLHADCHDPTLDLGGPLIVGAS